MSETYFFQPGKPKSGHVDLIEGMRLQGPEAGQIILSYLSVIWAQ